MTPPGWRDSVIACIRAEAQPPDESDTSHACMRLDHSRSLAAPRIELLRSLTKAIEAESGPFLF